MQQAAAPGNSPSSYQQLIDRATGVLSGDRRVRGVWLIGSRGRGASDRFSDVDLWIVVDPDQVDPFCADWPGLSVSVAPAVLQRRIGQLPTFHQITPDWLRWDLSIGSPTMIADRTRSTAHPLYDPDNLSSRLGEPGPDHQPDPARVEAITEEFFRVLGLLPVVVGREEWALAQSGTELLRSLLIQLLREDAAVEDRGGALHLNPLLSPERQRLLTDLPSVAATPESVIAGHLACAAAFLPFARDIGRRCGLTWPTDLETAVRRHLQTTLSLQLPAD